MIHKRYLEAFTFIAIVIAVSSQDSPTDNVDSDSDYIKFLSKETLNDDYSSKLERADAFIRELAKKRFKLEEAIVNERTFSHYFKKRVAVANNLSNIVKQLKEEVSKLQEQNLNDIRSFSEQHPEYSKVDAKNDAVKLEGKSEEL